MAALTSFRPTVAGLRHAVVAGHHLATLAGYEILEAGGNAVDAGVAAGIALSVLHPDQVNFAGVAPMLVYTRESGAITSIDGLGWWPRAARREVFEREHGGKIPHGILRTVVPAAPRAWITALERFGTISFGQAAAAAIRHAKEGFPMYSYLAQRIAEREKSYRQWPLNASLFLPGGAAPKPGDLFVQSDLARTLQYMADEESAAGDRKRGLAKARDAFYIGDIARAICGFHRENGGWLDESDLAGYEVTLESPLEKDYEGTTVYSCGVWSQGPAMLQLLGLLRGIDLRALGHNSAAYLHTLIEAVKLVFADREALYGDPRFVDVPLQALLSDEYARQRRQDLRPGIAWPGLPPLRDPRGDGALRDWDLSVSTGEPPLPSDTSQVCVVDRWGNAFSATPSDTSYDTPMVPGTGLCPSSRGSQSWVDPRHPSCLAPGKRPRLTPNPCLAMRQGEWIMPFGTPGGDVQVQANLQVFLNITVFGMDPQVAVEAPRFVSYSFPDSFAPHAYFPGKVKIESRIPEAVTQQLEAWGHDVERAADFTDRCGGVCAIQSFTKRGLHLGGADPRRAAYVLAS